MSASSGQPSLLYSLSVLLVGLAVSWLVRNPSSKIMKRLPPRGALPRPVLATSHNDEMQAHPLNEALSNGIPCIEVDVWLSEKDGTTLLAGHEPKNLRPEKTLRALYLDPIMDLLKEAASEGKAGKDWIGLFPLAPQQELILMIDMKGDGRQLYPKLLEVLQPFVDANMLTSFRDGKWHRRPLTIIGTGDTPIGPVFHASPRHVFIDAPLLTLEAGFELDGEHHEWSGEIAPMASGRWLWQLSWPSVAALRKYSAAAHSRGIKARWWGTPRLVPYVRRAVWDVQLRAGVDWMNADDLADVATFLRNRPSAPSHLDSTPAGPALELMHQK